ncbi:MAG: hypothetical protein HYU66_00305 [Armatimonadetes bacterium]|nr:hypothetical protein [Armatimonadota bacterium]
MRAVRGVTRARQDPHPSPLPAGEGAGDERQGALGSYYTSADIADYLAERTIVPFLLDHAPGAAEAARRLLRAQSDRYLHEAPRHGLDQPLPEPPAARLDEPAPPELALPTETWRELLARRRRLDRLRERLTGRERRAARRTCVPRCWSG